jgi:hypothetical protein
MEHPQNNMDYVKGNFEIVPNMHLIPQMIGSTVKVYLAICKFSNKRGQCYPSYTTIGQWAGISRRQVIRSIKELERLRVITVVKQERINGSQTSNLFQIQQPKGSDLYVTPPSDTDVTQTILISNHKKKAGNLSLIKDHLENRYNININGRIK